LTFYVPILVGGDVVAFCTVINAIRFAFYALLLAGGSGILQATSTLDG
jgi:hypothetical protein